MRAWLLEPTTPARRAARLGVAAVAIAAAVALKLPLCPFALLTGKPCPGCGFTRATLALATGDVARAIELHPLSPIVIPLVAVLTALGAIRYVRSGSAGLDARWVGFVAAPLFVALYVVWVARFFGAFGGPVSV